MHKITRSEIIFLQCQCACSLENCKVSVLQNNKVFLLNLTQEHPASNTKRVVASGMDDGSSGKLLFNLIQR